MPRSAAYEDRNEKRLRGMEAFDRAQNTSERTEIMAEREINRQTRDARDFAFREAQAEATAAQKAAALSVREQGIQSGMDRLAFREAQAEATAAQKAAALSVREQGIQSGMDRLALQREKLEFDQRLKTAAEARMAEIHPITLATKEQDLQRKASDEKLDTIQRGKMEGDTAGFNDHMAELYARNASPDELQAGFSIGLASFPNVDTKRAAQVGSYLFKKSDGSPMDLDQMNAAAAALRAANPGANVTVSQKSGATISNAPQKIDPVLKDEADRLDKEYYSEVRAWQDFKKVKGNEKVAAPNEARIAELRAKRDEVGSKLYAPPAAPAVERTATNPNTGEKAVFRNGAWTPLTP